MARTAQTIHKPCVRSARCCGRTPSHSNRKAGNQFCLPSTSRSRDLPRCSRHQSGLANPRSRSADISHHAIAMFASQLFSQNKRGIIVAAQYPRFICRFPFCEDSLYKNGGSHGSGHVSRRTKRPTSIESAMNISSEPKARDSSSNNTTENSAS